MEAWYKLKNVPRDQIDCGTAKAALCVAMDKYVATVDRQTGKGMNLIKTHAPLDTPEDICLFGCAANFDSGPLESSHKDHCKKPTKLTQKQGDLLEAQVAKHISETYVLNIAKNMCF
jgi:hypothetical protein